MRKGRSLRSLLIGCRDRADVLRPFERGLAPNALLRSESRALLQASDAQRIRWRIIYIRTGIDRRTAVSAKGVNALRAAIGCLDVRPGLPADETKIFLCRRNRDAKCRSSQHLTVGAVAQARFCGIDLGAIGHLAA